QDIPLKILILDTPNISRDLLVQFLKVSNGIITFHISNQFDDALKILSNNDINTVIIDPINMGLNKSTEFILYVRENYPSIVFILFVEKDEDKLKKSSFYVGDRKRFKHYYKLDKRLSGKDFQYDLTNTILECKYYLSHSLTDEKISLLSKELENIKDTATLSNEEVSIPLKILSDIQTQLREIQSENKYPKYNSAEFLGPPASNMNSKNCFVIMPYKEEWSEAVEEIINDTCKEVGLEFKIAKTMNGRFIPNDIWVGITSALVIIADITGANPNVSYEIGLADAIGRDIILLSQGTKVPFDFSGQRLIVYENSVTGALKLKKELKKTMLSFVDNN
ncbi:MAG: hypothetical protein AB1775_01700, partial [Bacteroidota bacterium]